MISLTEVNGIAVNDVTITCDECKSSLIGNDLPELMVTVSLAGWKAMFTPVGAVHVCNMCGHLPEYELAFPLSPSMTHSQVPVPAKEVELKDVLIRSAHRSNPLSVSNQQILQRFDMDLDNE